jgi:hypothetical protein
MHLPVGAMTMTPVAAAAAAVVHFPGGSAIGTPAGIIGETLFCIEFLLGSSEFEVGAAVAAIQCSVLVHKNTSQKYYP